VSDDERSSMDITDDDDKVDSIKLAPRENMCDVLQHSDVSIDVSYGSKELKERCINHLLPNKVPSEIPPNKPPVTCNHRRSTTGFY